MIEVDAWKGRRVLVTGHTGFKGSWLSIWLNSLGAKVAGYALDPPTHPSLFETAQVGGLLQDHRGDICDAAKVSQVVAAFDPEVVFHLAAQPIVRYGYKEPVMTYATNVVGTASVLNACRAASHMRAIVNVTTDKCYENRDWVWGYRETDRLGGHDPYSSSKACAELVTDSFRRSFFEGASPSVGVATARAGNVIGGGDWGQDRLVPDLARAVAAGEKALIRSPKAVRPWQHVLDPLAGYILLAQSLIKDAKRYSGGWNFGPNPTSFQTVASVLRSMSELWRGQLAWSVDDADHPHEASKLLLDSTKAHVELGWTSRLTLNDALKLSVEWYDAQHTGTKNMQHFTERQIAAYADAGV